MNWTPKRQLAEWHLTYRCNLRCTGCNRMVMCPHTPDMTLEDAKEFINQANAIRWRPQVAIIGGEPTLHPDFDKFIDLAYEFSDQQVRIFSNAYSEKTKEILQKYGTDERVYINPWGFKKNSVLHLLQDYFLAPCDIEGGDQRQPCIGHSAFTLDQGGCGISVDALGYTVCAVGGAIDGVLGLCARTRRLANLFNRGFAASQTRKLCGRCGARWGVDQPFTDVMVVNGARMSPTWATAVERSRNGH